LGCTRGILEVLVGVELGRVEVVVVGGLLLECVGTLVGEKLQVAQSRLLSDSIE